MIEAGFVKALDDSYMLSLSTTEQEQLYIFAESFEIFRERNKKYKDLWKEGGWLDSVHHIRSKAARLATLLSGVATLPDAETHLDNALDLPNFAAFFVRNVRSARLRQPLESDGVKDKEKTLYAVALIEEGQQVEIDMETGQVSPL